MRLIVHQLTPPSGFGRNFPRPQAAPRPTPITPVSLAFAVHSPVGDPPGEPDRNYLAALAANFTFGPG